MKKQTAFVISLIAIAGFAALLVYGLRNARGRPAPTDPPKQAVLKVPRVDVDIGLEKALTMSAWENAPAVQLDTIYQVTALPWPKTRVRELEVRALRSGDSILFRLSWPDAHEDRRPGPGRFADGCAIMFPLGDDVKPASLLMGFLGKSNIWHWRADRDALLRDKLDEPRSYSDFIYPFEDQEILSVAKDEVNSAVEDLLAVRVGTITPKEEQDVRGLGIWTNGAWNVVFKRSIEAADPGIDASFVSRTNAACAFAMWNGAHGDRGGRKTITDFVKLELN